MSTTDPAPGALTALLERWKQGDRSVDNLLAERIYPVLRGIAGAQAQRNGPRLTLSATELAHEAYERLHRQREVDWQNRAHFFAVAATVIRRVVVDHLRERSAEKRGGDLQRVAFDALLADQVAAPEAEFDWLALDRALSALAEEDRGCVEVVELRVFSGLTVEQIAEVRQSSVATVGRQWRYARAWLATHLRAGDA